MVSIGFLRSAIDIVGIPGMLLLVRLGFRYLNLLVAHFIEHNEKWIGGAVFWVNESGVYIYALHATLIANTFYDKILIRTGIFNFGECVLFSEPSR